jgi:hypothetical protein
MASAPSAMLTDKLLSDNLLVRGPSENLLDGDLLEGDLLDGDNRVIDCLSGVYV